MEALPDAMTIHQDSELVYVIAAAVHLFGAESRDELVGQDSYLHVPPELISAQQARRNKVLQEPRPQPPVEQRRVRLDGSIVEVETVSSFILWQGRPAVVGVLRDISARKEAENNLAKTERRLSAVADHILGAVYQRVRSPDGAISYSYVSAGARDVVGITSDQITEDASVFVDAIREDFREQYRDHFRQSATDIVS